jgi:hypothetical protein
MILIITTSGALFAIKLIKILYSTATPVIVLILKFREPS